MSFKFWLVTRTQHTHNQKRKRHIIKHIHHPSSIIHSNTFWVWQWNTNIPVTTYLKPPHLPSENPHLVQLLAASHPTPRLWSHAPTMDCWWHFGQPLRDHWKKFVLTKWPPNKCVNRLQYIGFHRSVPPKKKFTYGFLYQENHRGSLLTPIKNQPRITRTSGIISWKPQPMDLKKSEKQKKQVSHFRKKKCSDEPAFFPLIMA